MREELDKLICEIIAASQRGNWDGIRKEYADRIEALYKPRPYSLDPNSKEYEYKVPEVGEYIDWWDTDAVKHGICWEHIYQELIDRKYLIGYLWLPSRTKDDFGR